MNLTSALPSEINHLTDKKSLFQPLYCTVKHRDVCVSPPPLSSLSNLTLIRRHGTSTTFMKPFLAHDCDFELFSFYFWVVWQVFVFRTCCETGKVWKCIRSNHLQSVIPPCDSWNERVVLKNAVSFTAKVNSNRDRRSLTVLIVQDIETQYYDLIKLILND